MIFLEEKKKKIERLRDFSKKKNKKNGGRGAFFVGGSADVDNI